MASHALLFFAFLLLGCYLACGDVIVGEMLHASSYRKRVTLRNTGPSPEPLSNYALRIYMNKARETIYALNPISAAFQLQAGANFSVCYSRSRETCDLKWGGLNFNGDDYIELLKNGDKVDAVGEFSFEGVSGVGWTVSGVPEATHNHLLVRKADVETGNLNWTASAGYEWTVYDPDTLTSVRPGPTSPAAPARSSTPSPGATSEDCWNARSELSSLPLDACWEPTRRETVVVGTYNTLFLFDGEDDPRAQTHWTSAEAAYAHLRTIAEVVRANAPDLLTLIEVEDLDILRDLVAAIGYPVYTPSFVQGRDSYTQQDVAVLTHGDLVRNASRTDCRSLGVEGSTCGATGTRTIGVSKNLITLYDSCLFGVKFAVVSVHFYAFPTNPMRCAQRESQARVIQDVVNSLLAVGFEVMVMGDLNDYSGLYEDTHPAEPTSRVLSMLRDPDGDGVDELRNVMAFLPQSERYTSWWDSDEDEDFPGSSEGTMIDHILLTRGLYSRVQRTWIDHRWDPEVVSDHWPLFVELSARPPVAT